MEEGLQNEALVTFKMIKTISYLQQIFNQRKMFDHLSSFSFIPSFLPLTITPKAQQKASDRVQWQRYHLGISHLFVRSLESQ